RVCTLAVAGGGARAHHDVEVVLATMGAPITHGQRAQLAPLPDVTVAESRYRLEWMRDPWDDVRRAGEWLLELEADVRPDVVHINGYAHAALPWSAPVCVVAHSCVLSWWRAVRGEAAPPSWDRYRAAVRAGLARAGMVIAPSAAMLAALAEYRVALREARVIPNARSAARFVPREKYPFVLTVARLWDEGKNAAAVERVAGDVPWPVYVAGDRGRVGEVPYRNASYIGRFDEPELARWMGHAAIYALPARYEPFGLSALEAALCGAALVLGDIPSLREVWEDAACYVHPDDHSGLRDVLRELAADGAARARLGAAARARAATYTPTRMAAAYHAAYRALLGAHRVEERACAS
ncbi:MAG: glycosyltransferase, partial [Gemmatimonadaceae bacterium]|nr:glycosyltransferase [Gemmatimonadaceae bacterium]